MNRCDIFCNVVDNYGDIGVCWRLARVLQDECGWQTRLWVDDLASFAQLCFSVDPTLQQQQVMNIEVCHWQKEFADTVPAELVIEAFACDIPLNYQAAMAQAGSLWINLEYLSAEHWVEGCHLLPSPHPRLPIKKYFFFPGFTAATGGLLLERDLFERRDIFCRDLFWQSLEIDVESALTISLFCYENEALGALFDVWVESDIPIVCCVPDGRVMAQVRQYFEEKLIEYQDGYQLGALKVYTLPFVEQPDFDRLLWACDINFVRGEDSCVRAQWAGKPFIWHIYRQTDGVHLDKLNAFLNLYCDELNFETADAVRYFWLAWNKESSGRSLKLAWQDFLAHRLALQNHTQHWAQLLSQNNLASNLLNFAEKIGTIRAFKN